VNLFHVRDGDPFVLQSRSNSGDGSHPRDARRQVWFGNLIAQDPRCGALHQQSRDLLWRHANGERVTWKLLVC
jgi:hypothetical protein